MRRCVFAAVAGLAVAYCGGADAQQSVVVPATIASLPIVGTVGASRIISGTAGRRIYVTAVALVPAATSLVTFTAGTGTNCGTGTTNLTGALTFAAGQTLNFGNGNGAVWVLPVGADLCMNVATAAAPGSVAYSKF
jgi:hypothetical protein